MEAVKSDLSGKTERSTCPSIASSPTLINTPGIVFIVALNAQRPPDTLPVDPKQVAADVETLHSAAKKREEVRLLTTLW